MGDALTSYTGLKLNKRKTVLLLSKKRDENDPIFARAAKMGIKVVTDGKRVMGVGIGTDEFVGSDIATRMEKYKEDLPALKYFPKAVQWSMVLLCTSTRPAFIQRAVDIERGVDSFDEFDKAVTTKIMDIMGIPAQNVDEWRDQVHNFRALSLRLSGGTVRCMARGQTRVGALRLARDSVGRYVEKNEPTMMGRLMRMWATPLRLHSIQAKDDYNPDPAVPEKDPNKILLLGHTLGNIPEECVNTTDIPGTPALDKTRSDARAKIRTDIAITDLILHTNTMRPMANSNQKHKLQLAAHCLSSSCVNTGGAIRYLPTNGNFMDDRKLQQTLRMRFGVPAGLPLHQWKCNCTIYNNHKGGADLAHAMDGDNSEETNGMSLEDQPLHGLICKRRSRRIGKRHDKIRDRLVYYLNLVEGVVATKEPYIHDPAHPMRRGDIRVAWQGRITILDIGITCPATASHVKRGSHKIPGIAAKQYHATKLKKYADSPTHFVPFIIETGGRLHDVARDFIDDIVDEKVDGQRGMKTRIFKGIADALHFSQSYMLAAHIEELSKHNHQQS